MNTIGKLYTLTSFGESHGEALGGVIDGCPAGVPLSLEKIQSELDRRKPGQSSRDNFPKGRRPGRGSFGYFRGNNDRCTYRFYHTQSGSTKSGL